MISVAHIAEVYRSAELLHSKEQVESALDAMAAAISARLDGRNPVVQCVMIGGLISAGKLATRLDFPLQLDYLHATRYQGETRGRELRWLVRPSLDVRGRSVLIIDDILDEGDTLAAIVAHSRAAGAREVLTAVLVEKTHDRKRAAPADFVGLQVDDRYVFGYGMDYRNYLRNAPGIFAVRD